MEVFGGGLDGSRVFGGLGLGLGLGGSRVFDGVGVGGV